MKAAPVIDYREMARRRAPRILYVWNCRGFAACLFLSIFGFSRAHARDWQSLYVFGDSYSDSGAGYVDGNGPTAVVYMAEALHIPFTYAGDQHDDGKSLNFAVSGAQTGAGPGMRVRPVDSECGHNEALFGRGMQNQVADFARRVQSGALQFESEKTLFFLAGGLNDANLSTTKSIENIEGELRRLYDLGGRYALVALMPTRLAPDVKSYKALNESISALPKHLRAVLPGMHVTVSRWGQYYDEVFKHPAKYGITNTKDRCAGRAVFGEDATPCSAPESYFFYHEGHPSTAVHRIVGSNLVHELAEMVP